MKKTLLLLTLLISSVAPGFAQEKTTDAKWIRFENFLRELSFKIPEGFFAYRNKEKTELYLSSYENKVSINVSLVKMLQPRRRLAGLEDRFDQFDCKYDYFTLGDLAGKIFTCESNKQFSKTIYLATDDKYCKFIVGADSADNVNVSLFLMSLRVHGAPMFPKYGDKPDKSDQVVFDSDVKNSPIVEQYLKMPDNENIRTTTAKDVKEEIRDADSTIYSRPLIFLRKRQPDFHGWSKGGQPVSYKVKLRIQFLAGGQIGKVELLASNNIDFANSIFDALKKLKFAPAQIDGKDVDVSRIMEFSFDSLII